MTTPASNLQTNGAKVAFTDYWEIDRVVFSHTDTFTVTNTVSTTGQTFSINMVGLNTQLGRPVGIFSTDGGVTWNDMLGTASNSTLSTYVVFPSVMVSPSVKSTNTITYSVLVNAKIGTGTTFSLICSIAVLAVDSPGIMTAIPSIASATNKTSQSTVDSSGNPIRYRQIAFKNIYSTPIGTTLYTVVHGLGYVPDAMVWASYGTADYLPTFEGEVDGLAVGFSGINAGNGSHLMFMDATNIYYVASNYGDEYLIRLYEP